MEVRPIERQHLADLRELKIEAARSNPTQFYFDPEDVADCPAENLAAGMSPGSHPDLTVGLFIGERLCGSAEFTREKFRKARHCGEMNAVFVKAEARGSGAGSLLVNHLLEHAKCHVDVLRAVVGLDNAPARRLYERCGFRPYGVRPRMIRHDGRDIAGELLMLEFR